MSVSVSVGASASLTLLERSALSSVASDGVQLPSEAGFVAGDPAVVPPAAGLLAVTPVVGAVVVGVALVVLVLEQPARAAAATAAMTSGVRTFTIFSPEGPGPASRDAPDCHQHAGSAHPANHGNMPRVGRRGVNGWKR